MRLRAVCDLSKLVGGGNVQCGDGIVHGIRLRQLAAMEFQRRCAAAAVVPVPRTGSCASRTACRVGNTMTSHCNVAIAGCLDFEFRTTMLAFEDWVEREHELESQAEARGQWKVLQLPAASRTF
jgi:hypothetical protein